MAGYIGSRVSNSLVTLDGVTIGSATKFQPFIGSIAPFAMASAPAGWLVCNGANYSQTTYADLYNVIAATWVKAWTNGEGITTGDYRKNAAGVIYIATSTATTSGSDVGDDTGVTWSASTDFLVPDLSGTFLRGTGTGTINSRNKGGNAVGAFSEDQFQGHSHAMRIFTGTATYGPKAGDNFNYASWVSSIQQPINWSTYGDVRYGNETMPYNASVQYCIKF